ncbi:MAG: AAA family ATPase [Candidatus Nanoarchaeia archaeon]|nr:AAA family ATPase [Candidatus Nanoarchaeia archaeon]
MVNRFKIAKITNLIDLVRGDVKELPESDLCIQTDTSLIQFTYEESKEREVKIIEPGCFILTKTMSGLTLVDFELRNYNLLKTVDNTVQIHNEANKFFSRLDIYKKRNRDPKRAILLYSIPGVGKTAAINEACKTFLKEEGTVVVLWDTHDTDASYVNRFFLNGSKFDEKVKKLILIIEDIGGGSVEDYHGPRDADTSLLNFLDGTGDSFKGIPTFIIATTNDPENTVDALIDRPGRFDKVIELKAPKKDECEELLKFFMGKTELTPAEIKAAELAANNSFSIAHLEEIVVRADLDDITVFESTKQLVDHKEKHKNCFVSPKKKVGIGLQ